MDCSIASEAKEEGSPQADTTVRPSRHVFVCLRGRPEGAASCAALGASPAFEHLRRRLAAAGPDACAGLRLTAAGCFNRCEEGPVIVVYPEARWYTYLDASDLDEIVDRDLLAGASVERLMLPDIDPA